MKNKDLMDITSNRSVYNKSRKTYLERSGKIKCARCPYNRGENDERKYYGSTRFWRDKPGGYRYPSWKLVSKNDKQWMKKQIKIERKYRFTWDIGYKTGYWDVIIF